MPQADPSKRHAPCRLIEDPPACGAWQMAVDEALLESAAAHGQSTLRFYGWSEPTLSLGYFQDYNDRAKHPPSQRCALVRRQTGGGAILHDRELTYSLTVCVDHPLAADSSRLYYTVHQVLLDTLACFDVKAELCVASAKPAPQVLPFLCFERRAMGDVLFDGSKICGSAQRRRRGAILQHGSLLWAQSPQAPELPGIEDLSGKRVNSAELSRVWQRKLAESLGLELDPRGLSADERQLVTSLAVEKYDSAQWSRRR